MNKRFNQLIYFILFFIYEEFVFSVFTFKHVTPNFIYVIIFSVLFGCSFYLLSNLLKNKGNHITSYVFLSFFTFLFLAQLVYNKIYASIISIYSILGGGTGQILQFVNQILEVVKNNWYIIVLMLLPLIAYIILDIKKMFDYQRVNSKKKLFLLLSILCIHIVTILSFEIIAPKDLYSCKHLYHDVHAPLLTTEKMGILTMMRLDIKRSVFGFTEKDLAAIEEPSTDAGKTEEETEFGYNVLDIDWDSLISGESDDTLKSMHTYFQNQTPSQKNIYTGMFEGKNLVVFVAEAFSQLAIRENVTPTLYKMVQTGFQFENFYTPLFPVSTADGEYITDTSLIPKEGVWSLAKIKGNYMPYSYANVFENLGYSSQAYHDNTATYYKRNDYIETMGYDSFKACRAGLDINCKIWPQSDVEMINATYNDYINDDQFLAYYMTVSGHLEYTRNGNMMVTKNWSLVKDLNYSDKAKSYLAAQLELDRAVESLMNHLTEAGKLEDTVIMITGDHYPYGLTLDEVNELSTYERDENFELHHMPFILWNSEMSEPVKVTKYASSLDVLPTILNLFGIEYDSRLLMGRDILSNSDGLVIFSNRSYITEKGKYNSLTKNFSNFNEEVDKEYINKIASIIYNKYKYSKLILETDYYRKLYQELGWEIKE